MSQDPVLVPAAYIDPMKDGSEYDPRSGVHLRPVEQFCTDELDYLRETVKEQAEIIRQLSGEKLEYEYIHPWDLGEMLNEIPANSITGVNEAELTFVENDHSTFIGPDGKKYKQSPHIPAKHTPAFIKA